MINRLDFLILDSLYHFHMTDLYHSMTITELLEVNDNGLGARATVYKKLKKMIEIGYVKQGVKDNHADTYYLTKKGIELIEGGTKE